LRPSKSHACEDTAARPSAPTRRCVLAADLGEHEGYEACSPQTSGNTKAILTLNDFDEGRGGGDRLGVRRSVPKKVGARRGAVYRLRGGTTRASVAARTYGSTPTAGPCSCSPRPVVDECDREHAFQPPQHRRRPPGRVGQVGDHRGRRRRVHLVGCMSMPS
jgi:hypothetical protein